MFGRNVGKAESSDDIYKWSKDIDSRNDFKIRKYSKADKLLEICDHIVIEYFEKERIRFGTLEQFREHLKFLLLGYVEVLKSTKGPEDFESLNFYIKYLIYPYSKIVYFGEYNPELDEESSLEDERVLIEMINGESKGVGETILALSRSILKNFKTPR